MTNNSSDAPLPPDIVEWCKNWYHNDPDYIRDRATQNTTLGAIARFILTTALKHTTQEAQRA